MKDLDFEMSTKNFLFKTANWLFHKGLVERLKNSLKIPVGEKIDNAKNDIQQKITNYKLSQGVSIQGVIDSISISEIQIAKNSIRPILMTTGKLNLIIKELD